MSSFLLNKPFYIIKKTRQFSRPGRFLPLPASAAPPQSTAGNQNDGNQWLLLVRSGFSKGSVLNPDILEGSGLGFLRGRISISFIRRKDPICSITHMSTIYGIHMVNKNNIKSFQFYITTRYIIIKNNTSWTYCTLL